MLFSRTNNWLLIVCTLFISCKAIFVPAKAEYAGYTIAADLPRDSVMVRMMQPYRDSIEKSMNEVIGVAAITLEKKQPEGTLGNFMADAILYSARKKFNTSVDAAVINYGGIRLHQLPKGEITTGKIFELMPFDNMLVLQRLKGSLLQEFLNFIADKGGWPVAGISMLIKDKRATNVLIGGKPLEVEKIYTIAISGYVASGGDNATLLKDIPQQSLVYTLRDAIFDYIEVLQAQGKQITATDENRIKHAQ
ncbi:MAG: 5'-nucleotidase C-terminal domain-containing protein [Flavisolibacter sp.]|jgi:2',3'-cyclic-nucleotide 2'-phosphodiesterase (5'-nucleotidase family)|nr:5'-nucleotidase C-terminal domain-containing protein [Flavisolibacter sp.]